jgi:hypothetical protein
MENIEELEKHAEIEMEKLGVAEDLGWGVAWFAACAAYLKWESWWLAAAVVLGGYFLVTYPYRRRESTASDAYHRASGTGKYYRPTDIHNA